MFVIAILVNVGMWFERFVIVVTSLHRDYLPSSWRMFYPTWVDILQFVGGFGLFATLFLLFIRFVPMVALSEVKACLPAGRPAPPPRQPSRNRRRSRLGEQPLRSRATATVRSSGSWRGSRAGRAAGGGRAAPRGRLPPARHLLAVSRSTAWIGPWGWAARRSRCSRWPGGCSAWRSPSGSSGTRAPSAYPLITGGKPLNSPEAFVPITFETTILYAAFGAVAGMLLLNGLPRLYHPVFRGRSFARATNDGFFLTVEARDPKFDRRETAALLAASGGTEIELLNPEIMPWNDLDFRRSSDGWRRCVGFSWGWRLVTAAVVSLMGLRGTVSDRRPLMLISDMDFQPRYNAQAPSPFFADGRAMRTPPAGTVPFGGADYESDAGSPRQNPDFLQDDDAYYRGKQGDAWVAQNPLEARHGPAPARPGALRHLLRPLPRRDRHGQRDHDPVRHGRCGEHHRRAAQPDARR